MFDYFQPMASSGCNNLTFSSQGNPYAENPRRFSGTFLLARIPALACRVEEFLFLAGLTAAVRGGDESFGKTLGKTADKLSNEERTLIQLQSAKSVHQTWLLREQLR